MVQKYKKCKPIKATLMSFTKNPEKVIYNCFMNMHNKISPDLKDIKLSKLELADFMDMLVAQPHQTVFEFVNTVWKIEGGSRAFQQQLTRHRTAAFSIQSLRIVNVNRFADKGEYTKSSAIKKNPIAEKLYDETMKELQERYKKLIDIGCPVEDARGILPLNIHSPITMAVNLRALYHMLELRFCGNTQEEFRGLALQMKSEVAKKLGKEFAKPMVPLCFKTQSCPSPFPCEKYKNFPRTCKMDVSRWLKG